MAERSPFDTEHFPTENPQDKKAKEDVDKVSRQTGYGELSSIATRTFRGINHRGFGQPLPMNKDQYGLTFFTRPRMNLSYDNLSRKRVMTHLLNNDTASIHSAIRTWLDEKNSVMGGSNGKMFWSNKPNKHSGSEQPDDVHHGAMRFTDSGDVLFRGRKFPVSDLVDPLNPFITLLTNSLIDITGWPDPTLDTYTSPAGLQKEEWSMADGIYRIHNTFDITANFKNMPGDPISLMFHIWCAYIDGVYHGDLDPLIDSIIENEIDYQTRIYRVTLDNSRNYVQKIAACGAAFPIMTPMGAHFNYSKETPYNVENDQISIQFRCMGADYLDPISIFEFNEVMRIFNPAMRDETTRGIHLKKLTSQEKQIFPMDGYPRINPDTSEFEIWVPRVRYNAVMNDEFHNAAEQRAQRQRSGDL